MSSFYYDQVLWAYNVVKTVVLCVMTALGPGPPNVRYHSAHTWSVPFEYEEGRDSITESAKGFLRVQFERSPEQVGKTREELEEGEMLEKNYIVTV